MSQLLVVDDNAIERELMQAHLSIMGLSAEIASGAREAFALLMSGRRYDLVMTDYKLHGDVTGAQLLHWVRGRPGCNRWVPFLAVTACAMNGDRERLLAEGMDGYVAKPFRHSELRSALFGLLSQDAAAPGMKGVA